MTNPRWSAKASALSLPFIVMSIQNSSGYSARVEMHLHLPGGEILPVAQSGPDFLILRQPVVRPPCEATLVVDVDGSITRFPSWLPNGINGLWVQGEKWTQPVRHGTDCLKAHHDEERGGYLHAENDNSPYDVDGATYCGRCHHWIPRVPNDKAEALSLSEVDPPAAGSATVAQDSRI